MRLLDFIMPEYNTKEELIINALNSISRQKNVNFKDVGIIIVSDGSKKMYKQSWFKQKFPKLNIMYYPKRKNEGPGLTRQYGIDQSEARFISFLDSDDELYSNDSLAKVLDTLYYEDVRVLFTHFVEEIKINNQIVKYEHNPQELPTLHGLFVERQLLIDNDVRFSPEIRYQEDTYFADVLIFGFDAKIIRFVTYLWKYNDESLVRADKKINWNVKIIEDFIKAGELIYLKLETLNKESRHRQILTTIFGAYFILQSEDFNEDEDRRRKNMDDLISLYRRVKDKSYNRFTPEQRNEIFKSQYETTSRSLRVKYEFTFDEYLERNNLV